MIWAWTRMCLRWSAALNDRWARRQRELDVQLLWPACVKLTGSRGEAEMAFLMHASMDPAWLRLGWCEVMRQVERLP
jgi:hypothetical protein